MTPDKDISVSAPISAANGILCFAQPFVAIGYPFPLEESKILSTLEISQNGEYNNFGALERMRFDLTRFLNELGNDGSLAGLAADSIDRMVIESLAQLEAETAWIAVRAFRPTAEFDTPRWHCDGHYFAPYEGESRKIVITLKGPGTRFAMFNDEDRASFNALMSAASEDSDLRQKIADLVPLSCATQADLHEAFLYIVGADYAAIHSEPPIHDDRLFMSIVPGSSAQIAELRERWQKPKTTYLV